MSLRRFQELFSHFLLEDQLGEGFLEFSRELSEEGSLAPRIGFSAYCCNRLGGLASAIADFYPTTREIMGADCFDMLAMRFAKIYPAMCGNLNDYGESFQKFIREEMPEVPVLSELAMLDWIWHRLFYARDESPISASDLALGPTIDPDLLYFKLPHGLKLVESDYPLLDMRRYAQQPRDQRDRGLLAGDGCRLVLWRLGYERRIEALDATAWNFLKAIQAGCSFQEIAETIFADLPEASIGSMLSQAMAKGWIIGVYTS